MDASFNPQPKPRKSDRPGVRRRKEIRRKDKALQLSVGGYGVCFNCREWKYLYGDHIIKRRFLASRHESSNVRPCCAACNVDLESLSADKLLAKFPRSPLRSVWKEVREAKGPIPLL